jgi:autotransporter-associated beta strand protein
MRSNRHRREILRRCIGPAATLLAAGAAHASTWSGGNGLWSSNTNPGWNTTGVPNATGAAATFSTAGVATVDSGTFYTSGTVEMTGSASAIRTISISLPGSGLTLNQDGAGSGVATIRNSDSNAGGRLAFSAGTLNLADDLLITNTGGSTAASGSITMGGSTTISGTGNLQLSNVSNDPNAGAIILGGASTFTGSTLVEKGAVTFSGNNPFGVSSNALTLGSAGNSATLISTTSSVTMANNFTVAATTGTNVLGSDSGAATNTTFSGTITLNGSLTVTSSKGSNAFVVLSNAVSGAGALTKIGAGAVRLSGANSYQGGTTISAGTLEVAAGSSTGSGNVRIDGSTAVLELKTATGVNDQATVTVVNGGTIKLSFASGGNEAVGALNLGGTLFNTPTVFSQSNGFVVNGVDYSSYFTGSATGTILSVPEPASASMILICGAGLLVRRKRKTQ